MRPRFFHVKYVVIIFLIVVCIFGFRRQYYAHDFIVHIVSDESTAYGGWFPRLASRIKFGTPDTWRDPLEKQSDIPYDYTHVLDPLANETFLSLKTGTEVMWDRLPIHLETTFKRFPHHQIYADTESQIGTETIIDVISMLPEALIGDLQLQGYRLRRDQQEEGWGWNANDIKQEHDDGWDLDKFKNIPMLLHAYHHAPKHCKWFIFMDDDSYMHTQSLGALLRPLNPREEHYIGSTAFIFGGIAEAGEEGKKLKLKNPDVALPFAHGGSGIIMSRAAIDALFWDPQRENDQMGKYAKWGIETCCGDALMAFMLREETGLELNKKVDPTELSIDPFQGERLENTVISAAAGGWCSRVITWHHLKSWEVQKLFDWETSLQSRKSNFSDGVLYSDFYHDFILPFIEPRRMYWDNMASTVEHVEPVYSTKLKPKRSENAGDDDDYSDENSDPVVPSYESPDACESACIADPRCLGWKFEQTDVKVCALEQEYVRRGVAKNPLNQNSDPDYLVVSGWILDRIRTIRSAEFCEALSYDLDTQLYSDLPTEQEGWYFRDLYTEQQGDTDRPVL